MIQHAKLSIPVPLLPLQNEVLALCHKWQPHFNLKHYEGSWTVLSLRSPNGETEKIIPELSGDQKFRDTFLLSHCPTVKKVIEGFHCEIMAVRLMKLAAGSVIKEHRDHDLAFEKGEARLHIPLFTNPLVLFYVNGVRVIMQEGECWYMNANLPHKVANHGDSDRIHLVIDCKVNDWLETLFEHADKVEASRQNDDSNRIIEELRLQNTEISNRLADELEQRPNLNSRG